jgi:hypothetical protein
MIRSMTGFGQKHAPWQDGAVTVEVHAGFLVLCMRWKSPSRKRFSNVAREAASI